MMNSVGIRLVSLKSKACLSLGSPERIAQTPQATATHLYSGDGDASCRMW